MKLIQSILLAAILLLPTYINAQTTWNKKKDLPEGREGAVCFSLNGKVYWGGGTSTGQTMVLSDFYEYDPTTNTWNKKNNMPEERMWGVSFAINGKGYVGLGKKSGGVNSGYLSTLYEYDAANDSWTKKANFPHPNGGLVQSSVFVINNKAYILGGYDDSFIPHGTLYEYEPASDQWTKKTNYPLTIGVNNWVKGPFAFSIGNKGYICGGEVRKASGIGTEMTKKSFEYDPSTDTWKPIADFIDTPRSFGTAVSIGNIGYCAMGYHRDANFQPIFHKEIFAYEPTTNTWSKMANNFPGDARVWAVAAVINNKAYAGGGSEHQSAYKKDWHEFKVPVSINDLHNSTKFRIFPNPAFEQVTVQGIDKNYSYTISNIQGQVVINGKLNNNENNINLSSLNTGTYFIKIQSEHVSIWRKMVKL